MALKRKKYSTSIASGEIGGRSDYCLIHSSEGSRLKTYWIFLFVFAVLVAVIYTCDKSAKTQSEFLLSSGCLATIYLVIERYRRKTDLKYPGGDKATITSIVEDEASKSKVSRNQMAKTGRSYQVYIVLDISPVSSCCA